MFDGTTFILQENKKTLSGEFTILFWVKSVNFLIHTVQPVVSLIGSLPENRVDVFFNGEDILSIGLHDSPVMELNNGWRLYAIIRDSSNYLKVYEDGQEMSGVSDFTGSFGGESIQIASIDGLYASNMHLSGLKIIPRAMTIEDLAFHYTDTIDNSGEKTWP